MTSPINLLPSEHICRRLVARRVRAWAWVVIGCASVTLPIAGLLRESPDSGLIERLERSSERVDRAHTKIAMLDEQSNRLAHQARVAQISASRPAYAYLINAVSEAMGDRVAIERISVERIPDASGELRPTLVISGLTQEQIDAQRLAVELEEVGIFLDVNLLESRRRSTTIGDLVGFRLAGVLDGVQP